MPLVTLVTRVVLVALVTSGESGDSKPLSRSSATFLSSPCINCAYSVFDSLNCSANVDDLLFNFTADAFFVLGELRMLETVFAFTTQLPLGVAFMINLISSVAPALQLLLKLDADPELHVDRLSSVL